MLMEHQFDQDRLIEKAWISNAGFTVLRDMGLDYETACKVAFDEILVDGAYAIGHNRGERMSEMVALVLQQPEIDVVDLRVRV